MEDVVTTVAANPLARDLEHVLAATDTLWEEFRGARLFITGGSGFFGCWLLESLVWANERRNLGASAVVLTRNGAAFGRKAPHLAFNRAVTIQDGDVRTFAFADGGFSHVIHAAVDARPPRTRDDRQQVFDTIVDGTRRTLEFARRAGAGRFLLASTGAVYGRQPPELDRVAETYAGGPDSVSVAHIGAAAKRAAETLCAVQADAALEPVIARCFAFVGPYLPLDAHFAAGNFIRDALGGGPIRVLGDGTPLRSYMYAADLAIWLWTILHRGQSLRPYNVGSEAPVSIAALAQAIARQFTPAPAVVVEGRAATGTPAERYVPATARARTELGLATTIELDEALRRTVEWHVGN